METVIRFQNNETRFGILILEYILVNVQEREKCKWVGGVVDSTHFVHNFSRLAANFLKASTMVR